MEAKMCPVCVAVHEPQVTEVPIEDAAMPAELFGSAEAVEARLLGLKPVDRPRRIREEWAVPDDLT